MRAGFTFLPGVYDALVGPLFGVAALDRTTPVPPGPGNVLAPGSDGHSLRGSQPGPLVAMGRNVATLVRGRRRRDGRGPRRRRDRRRPQRAGRGQPAGRRRLVGRAAGGAADGGRRRRQRPRGAPGLRARHLQLVLPAGRSLADPRVVRPRASRPRVAARAGGARPPAARRQLGAAAPRPARHGPAPRRPARRRRRGLAAAVRAVGHGRRPARDRPAHALPTGPGAAAAGAEPAPRRRARRRQDAADAGGLAGATSSSAATTRGCCCPATPATRTSRWTPPAPA